jgi:hypothetical protein
MTSGRASLGAAKAASDEGTAPKGARLFVWRWKEEVETDEGGTKVEDREVTLTIPRKFKRLKFTRLFASGDVMGALELIVGKSAVADLEEIEMDDEEFELFMERLGECIAGTSAKN